MDEGVRAAFTAVVERYGAGAGKVSSLERFGDVDVKAVMLELLKSLTLEPERATDRLRFPGAGGEDGGGNGSRVLQ